MWAAQFIRFNDPRLWINSGGLGAMGFGLPSAIGAQFARPDKLVFALVGDGGFQMSIPELSTIASHGLPIKIIVMNNGYLGMVRQWQELFYNNRLSSVELDCFPDAEKLAACVRFQRPHHRQALGTGLGARRSGARTRAVPAQREGDRRSKTSIPWCPPAAPSTKWCSRRRNRWPCPNRILHVADHLSISRK